MREVRCACPPLVPFLVTFCGTTKSNCPRGMSANSKKKKSPIPRTKPGHRRIDRETTKSNCPRGMSANYKPLQSAKREFQSFCTCAEAPSYNNFSPVRRAVPFFCTEKRNQKACPPPQHRGWCAGRLLTSSVSSLRSSTASRHRGSLPVPEVMRTAQNIIRACRFPYE